MLSNIVLFSNDCLRKPASQAATCNLLSVLLLLKQPRGLKVTLCCNKGSILRPPWHQKRPHTDTGGTGGHMGDALIQQEHSDSDESLLTRSQDKHHEWHHGLKKKLFFVNCLSHQYLNVNSPCQCRSVLKWRQTLRGPRLFTAETLSMRQKIGKLNMTLFYCKLCWYFLCQGNDKCKKK